MTTVYLFQSLMWTRDDDGIDFDCIRGKPQKIHMKRKNFFNTINCMKKLLIQLS